MSENIPRTDHRLGDGKVNLLILASSLWIGGAETVMRHLAETIDPKKFKVTICHLKQRGQLGDELAKNGLDIIGISDNTQPKVDYLTFIKVLKLVRAKHINVIHTHTTHGLVDASLCRLLSPSLRIIHTFHFGNYPHTRPRVIWMERVFSRIANRLFAVGEVQRQQLRSLYHFRERRIQTIPNGVNIRDSLGDPTFRVRVGAEGKVLVGTIATLIEQKGLRDLLAVAERVRDAGVPAVFVVVGEGHLRSELESMCFNRGLRDVVRFTGWITNAAEVALPQLDIFFQPSLWEAMSVVILEAMAATKAIVATRVGETPLIIEDGVDGLLVDPKDVDGMAAALRRLIDDVALRQRLGRAARRKVEQQYTVQHMTRSYEQAYLEALR